MDFIKNIKFNIDGLVPAIAQDYQSGKILMMAWMNKESIQLTIETGFAYYYSRSRNALWKKGETSGNTQKIISGSYDCDGDTILLIVNQLGPACHTGNETCFFNTFIGEESSPKSAVLNDVFKVILDRQANPKEGSYTNYLLDKGVKKICKKVGEEASEVIIGAVSKDSENVKYETADLLYHLSVLLVEQKLTWEDIFNELKKRR